MRMRYELYSCQSWKEIFEEIFVVGFVVPQENRKTEVFFLVLFGIWKMARDQTMYFVVLVFWLLWVMCCLHYLFPAEGLLWVSPHQDQSMQDNVKFCPDQMDQLRNPHLYYQDQFHSKSRLLNKTIQLQHIYCKLKLDAFKVIDYFVYVKSQQLPFIQLMTKNLYIFCFITLFHEKNQVLLICQGEKVTFMLWSNPNIGKSCWYKLLPKSQLTHLKALRQTHHLQAAAMLPSVVLTVDVLWAPCNPCTDGGLLIYPRWAGKPRTQASKHSKTENLMTSWFITTLVCSYNLV